jgi:GDP-4-dehydro-6-deoxy-D-mannose reductase
MRVLITGVTGFVGRHLAAAFASEDAELIGLGRRPAALADAPAELAAYVECDLTQAEAVREAVREAPPDRVFHLAAEASVARSWQDPAEVMRANAGATLNLLEAVRAETPRARVLLACSGEEYGSPDELPVTEESPLRPRNPYAVSKAAADLLGAMYGDAHGVDVVRTRAFNHAGPGQSDAYVVSTFARQVAAAEATRPAGDRIEIEVGNLEAKRDFTDVRDVVRAYRLALEKAPPAVYNVCRGKATSIADILAGVAARSQLRIEPRIDEERLRANEVMEIRGSHDKLSSATGWRPEIPLERTLADTLEWWRKKLGAEVVR